MRNLSIRRERSDARLLQNTAELALPGRRCCPRQGVGGYAKRASLGASYNIWLCCIILRH